MIIVGLCCVLGAIGLLVAGLAQADSDLVWASITASALGGLAVAGAAVQRGRALRRADVADVAAGKAPVARTDVAAGKAPVARTDVAAGKAPVARTAAEADAADDSDVDTGTDVAAADAAQEVGDTPDADVDVDTGSGTDVAAADAAQEVGDTPDADADADVDTDTDVDADVMAADAAQEAGDTADIDVDTDVMAADADQEAGKDEVSDPVDEPGEEDVDPDDLLMIIDLSNEVLVVDLRPRYHMPACTHLDSREAVPLPVNEAREDGFTPCRLCRPDATLAARARRLGSANN